MIYIYWLKLFYLSIIIFIFIFTFIKVLKKISFARLALKYSTTIRTMRQDILNRISQNRNASGQEFLISMDTDDHEFSRKKTLKRIIQLLKRRELQIEGTSKSSQKDNILNLYTISENLPRVGTTKKLAFDLHFLKQ